MTQNQTPERGKEQNLEEPQQAGLIMISAHDFGPKKGMIFVYEVRPEGILSPFYLATFDDEGSEVAWGMGSTPKKAIEDAAKKWVNYVDEEEGNPFQELPNLLEEVEEQ